MAINGSAALVAVGIAENFRDGTRKALQAIESGAARAKLEELRNFGRD